MKVEANGQMVNVPAAEQSADWLLSSLREIADEANERGLAIPFATGALAVEAAIEPEVPEAMFPPTKESFIAQLPTAYAGYELTTSLLNKSQSEGGHIPIYGPETLQAELEAWLTDEKVAYVASVQEADPNTRFVLVARNNAIANKKAITSAVRSMTGAHISDKLYSYYTSNDLSGAQQSSGNALVFSLIPTRYTPDMKGPIAEQRAKLASLQADHPFLKVPSLLDAVTYWQTLKAQGYSLKGMSALHRTYIRHFDLPEQPFDSGAWGLDSYIDWNGAPSLRGSISRYLVGGRVAIG